MKITLQRNINGHVRNIVLTPESEEEKRKIDGVLSFLDSDQTYSITPHALANECFANGGFVSEIARGPEQPFKNPLRG